MVYQNASIGQLQKDGGAMDRRKATKSTDALGTQFERLNESIKPKV
jgi:hypothetical protein